MDQEKNITQKLEEESQRLSKETNPRNLGIDVLVFSVTQLIKSLNRSNKTNKLLAYIMIGLTLIIAIFTAKLVFPSLF